MRKRYLEDRDGCAHHAVSIWRDAVAFRQTHNQVMDAFTRLWESPRYRKLPQYQREYVRGYSDSYKANVIERERTEHGSWVTMPDDSCQWFGALGRTKPLPEGITYQYINEHAIPERSGIYWVGKNDSESGVYPYFIPAIDFDPYWKKVDGKLTYCARVPIDR